MRHQLAAIAHEQHGCFTRDQALACGYTPRELKALTRPGGEWGVVRHGTYCLRATVDALQPHDRWLLRDFAALLVCRRPALLSHDSAARLLRIRTLDVDQPQTHLTLHGPRGCRRGAGITRHRDLLPLCVEVVDGVGATSYARTAIDLGRLHGYEAGLVAADAVREMGVPLLDLHAELARMEHHPHIARARAAVAASDAGAESVLETFGRELVKELGIGEVETQFAVCLSGGRIAWCDLLVGCHVFECDGFIKLVDSAAGGVATEPAAKVLWKAKRRQTEICAQGLGLSTIHWGDLHGSARERALRRLHDEYAVTEARFGRVLPPHLRSFADAHPRRRRPEVWTNLSREAA